ncbi:pectate lyase [Desertivirga arenae]|uniref:pectate lyase n=1 Tax=Desertivirga arenae TaxID=2810309 RepID=UPI001A95F5BD|nr:pectate lyase [Pedobacter sp. SYSU D00823]
MLIKNYTYALLALALAFAPKTNAQDLTRIDPAPFADNSNHWYGIADKGNVINPRPGRPKYQPTEVKSIADNIILFQKTNGGWPKNYDIFAILSSDQKDSVLAAKNTLNTTFDNGSTYTQIAALAIAYVNSKEEKYKVAAENGLNFIIGSQYPNGGWPQYFPLEENYSRHITYNDGAFCGIMTLLKDIKDDKKQYYFINNKLREKIFRSYEKGLGCIVKTQIKDNGKLTAWCQQHDERTLAPAWARKFEPPSICNKESADLVLFLMSIDNPDKQVENAIVNAVDWFRQSQISNTVVKTVKAEEMVTNFRVSHTDRVVATDSNAAPIWTRYYELRTHRPLFCNRDSKVVYSLAEVDRERRDGYAWYTYSPQEVLNKYPEWQRKHKHYQ